MNSSPTKSETAYAVLLKLYPCRFRERFERQMRETFRDQLRDANQSGGRFAKAVLWMTVVPDLLWSAMKERLMTPPAMRTAFRALLTIGPVWLAPLLVVLLLTAFTTGYTLMKPTLYRGTADVEVMAGRFIATAEALSFVPDPENAEPIDRVGRRDFLRDRLLADELLDQVAESLNLAAALQTQRGLAPRPEAEEVRAWLRSGVAIEPRPVPESEQLSGSILLRVAVLNEDPKLAANIANQLVALAASQTRCPAIEEAYRPVFTESAEEASSAITARMTVVNRAEPGLRPASPNIPKNMVFGVVAAFILGGSVWVVSNRVRRHPCRPVAG